ncbi:hypothetical protein DNFV4_03583 [Nitrospira tepida]|uniref:Uncharacterized protein n=1 Tax=Nitrospira tepida TaxID=2973512 RepID=A0AA86T6L9_9BACT|nr:hypothetical protein DNFV4_03583 [Nitrospira tepida]
MKVKEKMRRLLVDIIISAFFGGIFGGIIGVLSYALSFLMPWLTDRQKAAIIPVSIVIGFCLGICMVFVHGKGDRTR